MKRPTRPAKLDDVPERVRTGVEEGNFVQKDHAIGRQQERSITLPEILRVLKTGHHEKKKDEFKDEFGVWNYAIKGRTVDGRELRVIMSFDEEGTLLIITAIAL